MALPHLVKHIYNFASDEVVKRGKKIMMNGYVELVEYDELLNNVTFRVRDDSYVMFYKVHINNFTNNGKVSARCTCPYNITEVCRHKAAALFKLQDLIDKKQLGDNSNEYRQKHTVVKMKQLELKFIRLLSSSDSYEAADEFLRTKKAKIIEAKDERVKASVNFMGQTFQLILRKNEERTIDTSCTCDSETKYPLCVHKVIVLLQLVNTHGTNYFDSIRNWDWVKNKLLAQYGYSLKDNLKKKFEFTYSEGRPFLRVLDPSIKKVEVVAVEEPVKGKSFEEEISTLVITPKEEVNEELHKKLGVVLSAYTPLYPYIQFEAIQGDVMQDSNSYDSKVEKLDLNKFINTEVFNEDDKILLQWLRKLLPSEINRYLNRNSPFSGIWENIVHHHGEELPEDTKNLIIEFLHPKIKKIIEEVNSSTYNFYLPTGQKFVTDNLQQISFSPKPISPEIKINYANGQYIVSCYAKLPYNTVEIEKNDLDSTILFMSYHEVFLWENIEDIVVIEKFLPTGSIVAEEDGWNKLLNETIMPLSKKYKIDFGNVDKKELTNVIPKMQLMLEEKSGYLIFKTLFTYNDYLLSGTEKETVLLSQNGQLIIVNRNIAEEQRLKESIEKLHSNFIHLEEENAMALKMDDVLKNNWFFLFVDSIKDMNVALAGLDNLRNFRFNTAKPSTKIFISSNTDWFDAKVEIVFGDQTVTVADIKHAIANKQQFVNLKDGTLGILPEEWLKKYSLLFKVGDAKGTGNNLKLNKYQLSVIEDLYEQRDEEELFIQLEERYNNLRTVDKINEVQPPEHLKATLRPYQQSGFQWLNYLEQVRWGGILADDMGLGKTIQTLTFMEYYKIQNGKIRALVVCPTSLMYNWKNEIAKFTPSLSMYIHHGGSRLKADLNSEDNDVIITTYGTLRSDIKQFTEIAFDYVVLDESQAIKNPSSKIAKAVCLLEAKNKLCLSGTPLQNNTFDIFAQMNFLNPGMLGSIDFFKHEFAVPIDKFGEKIQKDHLRKLLFPFILRRTKEQVAKDLPEKQESILYCEMGAEQRKIYDGYRNDYRARILGLVDSIGINKSQLTILQGLMKLRQICDSPAILKEEERLPNVSVKIDELTREIAENISNHKALIFSQFLGMLALIKDKLNEMGIVYEYFDGSSTINEREKAITNFQNDEKCRVFVISLKAGGVGLNLTAADYVYIVDPWWNPAVEQQAIDRTHRIGQTKNIFAYRMICTETVEDKIIQLQEKKKSLARDLISDEESFVKKLTRDDIEYLFS